MKYFALQVDPEYSADAFEIDILSDEYRIDYFAIYGNKRYKGHIPDSIKALKDRLDDGTIEQALFDPRNAGGCGWYEWPNSTAAMNDICPKQNGQAWSAREIATARHALKSLDDDDFMAALLIIVTGDIWETVTIRGCCQSDWNRMLYNTSKISGKYAGIIEKAYFGMNDAWMIADEELPDDATPEDVKSAYMESGFYLYTYEWGENEIKAEIAEHLGVDAAEITLYRHIGYTRISKYEAA